MRRTILAVLIALPTPTIAGSEADSAFYMAAQAYAFMKASAVICDLPLGDTISTKVRVLSALSTINNVDIVDAERNMERSFESEKRRMGSMCSDDVKSIYKSNRTIMEFQIKELQSAIAREF